MIPPGSGRPVARATASPAAEHAEQAKLRQLVAAEEAVRLKKNAALRHDGGSEVSRRRRGYVAMQHVQNELVE